MLWWYLCIIIISQTCAIRENPLKVNITFVCLEFFVPLENFSLIWRRHHCRWRSAHFDLRLALVAIEQWGFFNVPHPLWHGPNLYNGHLRGSLALTPFSERLAVKLSLPVFTTLRGSNPDLLHTKNVLPLHHRYITLQLKYQKGLLSKSLTWAVQPHDPWRKFLSFN